MSDTLIRRARRAPGWADWARRQALLDQERADLDRGDSERLGRVLGQFVDPIELGECVGAVMAAGFHR